MSPYRQILILVLLLALGVSMVGCKQDTEQQPPEGALTDLPVAVYYVKMDDHETYLVREVHPVPETAQLWEAALQELITGQPYTEGAFSVLPPETEIRDIHIADGLATINFSREVLNANVGASTEALGIQSIVNTLTEFPHIEKVAFKVEGKLDQRAQEWWGHVGLASQPFGRELSLVWEPAIWVTAPQPGSTITSPLLVEGTARVFEGTVNLRLVTTDGKVLGETFTTADNGVPERGQFKSSLPFQTPGSKEGYLEVFWLSPKDGSELDNIKIPLILR